MNKSIKIYEQFVNKLFCQQFVNFIKCSDNFIEWFRNWNKQS